VAGAVTGNKTYETCRNKISVYQVPVLDWVAVSVWMQNLSLAAVG
jgi:hypothetical protein